MNLSAWAGQVGVSRHAVCRWYHAGRLPAPARGAGRLILVEPAGGPAESGRPVMYVRVSSAGQRPDLGRQIAGLSAWVTAARKLGRLLADPPAARVAIGHRGRLARFGVGHLQAAFAAQGRQIMILDPGEVEDDLVRDMTEVLTSFCARLYGRRGARNRALRALGWPRTGTPGA
jgi:putative resolvase